MKSNSFFFGSVSAALLLTGNIIGCGDGSPRATDLSKTPWLDPKVQLQGLKDSDMRIRTLSAINLGSIGAAASDAIPELEKLARTDSEPKVRENAAKALEKIRAASN